MLPARLAIATHSRHDVENREACHNQEVIVDIGKRAALQHHHSYHFLEVFDWVEVLMNLAHSGMRSTGVKIHNESC